jgi:hypothetical protein
MLADEIVATGLPGTGCAAVMVRPVIARIQKAQKYVLAPQFAAVADALGSDYGSLVRAFPFCRLPYPEVWIELAAADRPNFMAAELQAPGFQGRPKRIGFLCSALRSDLSAWRAHLFWTLRDTPKPAHAYIPAGASGAAMAMNFDMLNVLDPATEADLPTIKRNLRPDVFIDIPNHPGWEHAAASVKLAMIRHTHPITPDWGLPDVTSYLRTRREIEEAYDLIQQLARSDWAGEVAYLLAVIGLMNARNASDTVASNLGKLNRARIKRAERPLFEHHILKIHEHQQRRVSSISSATHAPMRGHFVSGHWKVRKTGIYFWRPFKRGDFRRGTISKDYRLDR